MNIQVPASGQLGVPRTGRWMLAVGLLYLVLAAGALLVVGQRSQVAVLWFANPVGTVALLAMPRRQWLPMLAVLGLANLLGNLLGAGGVQSLDWHALAGAASHVPGNCFEMVLSALLLRRAATDADIFRLTTRLLRVLLRGALVPTLCSAIAGAALLTWDDRSAFPTVWATWFAGSLIGTVAVLPLALSVWLQGWPRLLDALSEPRTGATLLISLAVTLLAATTLSEPFVVMVLPMMFLAARSSFSVTALATMVNALTVGALSQLGVLVLPPGYMWWSDSLFYGSLLATLLPGLFLAASVEGQAEVMQQLAASEARFRKLYTQTPAMLHSIDARGRILGVSQVWLDTLGYRQDQVIARPLTDFFTLESARYALEKVFPQSMADGRCDNIEYQMVTRDGQTLDVLLSSVWERDAEGNCVRALAALLDVTEKKRLVARSHFAEHDALTGLPNRVLLQDRLERNCTHHARHGGSFAVGFLDLDHFKAVNDQYGHDAGDILLCEVARRLKLALRESDTVCRLGGDEFVLLFTETGQVDDLQKVAAEIFAQVAQPCKLGEGADAPTVDVAVSLGVAVFPDHGRDPQTLLQRADQAMYSAKRGGRNRFAFYQS